MRAAFWLVCGIAAASSAVGQSAVAQSAPPGLRPTSAAPPPSVKPPDPAIEAARLESERRLKRRDDQSRRTLRSICKGC